MMALSVASLFFVACGLQRYNMEQIEVAEPGLEKIPSDYEVNTPLETAFSDYEIGSCDKLAVEIRGAQSGMVFPRGILLLIRVLKDGRAEFDDIGAELIPPRREIVLNSKEKLELFQLLNLELFSEVNGAYVSNNDCLDSYFRKDIYYCPAGFNKIKKVEIEECGTSNVGGRRPPPVIGKLFRIVEHIIATTPKQ